MKKDELKKAFESEFNNITVSNELKAKTLKAINSSYAKKPSHFLYLKNFAAMFIVTMLCISIYFTRNIPKNETTKEPIVSNDNITYGFIETQEIINSENLNTEAMREETILLSPKSSAPLQSTSSLNDSLSKEKSISNFSSFNLGNASNDIVMADMEVTEEVKNLEIKMSEDEFLKLYPTAEKIENGYKLYEDNKEIIYIFKDGLLENTIINIKAQESYNN